MIPTSLKIPFSRTPLIVSQAQRVADGQSIVYNKTIRDERSNVKLEEREEPKNKTKSKTKKQIVMTCGGGIETAIHNNAGNEHA
jgi:hypothetical protein